MGKTNPKSGGQRFRRALMLPRRYGLTPKKFYANLEGMVSLLKKRGVVGTFPVTAIVLERHPELARILEGMEVAVHGFRHRDISHLDARSQEMTVRGATEIFRTFKLEVKGFRAPYLRWSEVMIEGIAAAGHFYDSSIPAGWSCGSEIDSRMEAKRAMAAYGVDTAGGHSPSLRGKLIEMPVAIPDDEILIDRLDVTSSDGLSRALMTMTESAIVTSSHLVFQLHPERFNIFEKALDGTLSYALAKRAWIAPLKEVAGWWLTRPRDGPMWPDGAPCAMTISGDIDAVTIGDFVLRKMGR